jgi:hypothetical protein
VAGGRSGVCALARRVPLLTHDHRGLADGSTAETLATVIGGHEEKSVSEATTLDSDFLTMLIRASL